MSETSRYRPNGNSLSYSSRLKHGIPPSSSGTDCSGTSSHLNSLKNHKKDASTQTTAQDRINPLNVT